ncbi:MAG: arylesterase [Pseudomonadota bacterium]|nr:arylesterase [Pseudomonadota bacterium]
MERHPAIPVGATVLVLGDSLSYGTGAAHGEDYPTLLADMTGWNVVNAGVPGDTTADGLKRLPGLLEEHIPKLVLVELGGNDFLRQVPPEQVAANLKAILAAIKAQGIPAVVLAIPRPALFGAALGRLSDAPIYEEISKKTPVMTDVLSDVLGNNALKADPLHPNAAGYRRLAEGLREKLKEQGFLR